MGRRTIVLPGRRDLRRQQPGIQERIEPADQHRLQPERLAVVGQDRYGGGLHPLPGGNLHHVFDPPAQIERLAHVQPLLAGGVQHVHARTVGTSAHLPPSSFLGRGSRRRSQS